MSMTWREASLRDVDFVLGRLSPITRSEMRTCGLTSPDVMWMARSHWLHVGRAYVFMENATPVAVFGITRDKSDPECLTTWLISTKGFHRPKWTLFARKFLLKVRADNPESRLLTTTYSAHPTVNRWFQLLGFEMLSKTEKSRTFEHLGASTNQPE